MIASGVSPSPTSAPPEQYGLQRLPTVTRVLYRWCVSLINRTLERFPGLRHGIKRLEVAETTIRQLRYERDEALGFLRERNNELAHYDTALRNFFAAVGEVTRELEAIRRDVAAHQARVAEHTEQLVNHILYLQQRLREAALDMQEAQADLDAIASAFRSHQAQLDRRIGQKDMALLGTLDAAQEAETELELFVQQVDHYQRALLRVYREAMAENARLSQELETIVAEVAQTNSQTAAYIQALEAELAALRTR
ncbi:MAG: hypothetical protein NZ585_08640 [Chloracidobacterium sp.]|nr:hypothetical protein [Chloracidobacterium sp.]MDW8217371.1 hypothetical protein [Acidobacteriota bacterium]